MEQKKLVCICGRTVQYKHRKIHFLTRYHKVHSGTVYLFNYIEKKYNMTQFTFTFW